MSGRSVPSGAVGARSPDGGRQVGEGNPQSSSHRAGKVVDARGRCGSGRAQKAYGPEGGALRDMQALIEAACGARAVLPPSPMGARECTSTAQSGGVCRADAVLSDQSRVTVSRKSAERATNPAACTGWSPRKTTFVSKPLRTGKSRLYRRLRQMTWRSPPSAPAGDPSTVRHRGGSGLTTFSLYPSAAFLQGKPSSRLPFWRAGAEWRMLKCGWVEVAKFNAGRRRLRRGLLREM